MAEHQCLKRLHQVSLNVDQNVVLQFEQKADCRDARPLCYSGKLLTGLDCDGKSRIFQRRKLWQEGRTDPAQQLLGGGL